MASKEHRLRKESCDLLICCKQRSDMNRDGVGIINEKQGSRWRNVCNGFPIRLLVALLACVGVFNTNCLRLNISIALVAMVNETAIIDHRSNESVLTFGMCPHREVPLANLTTEHQDEDGPFEWDEATLGIILSAYFWGNVFAQIPGGILADRFGGKWPFGLGVLTSAVSTLFIPMAAYVDVKLVIALRVICGLSQGLALPAMFSLLSKWVPKDERSRLTGLTYCGVSLGKVFVFPISAALCESSLLGGWPLVFYVFGAIPIFWFIFWALLIYDSPEKDPKVNETELMHIQEKTHIVKGVKMNNVNWKRLFTSGAFWAMILAYFAQSWGANTLLTILPSYLKFALGFDMSASGLINGLPHGVAFVVGLSASWTADWLINSKLLGVSAVRKLFVALAMYVPMGCLLAMTFTPCSTLILIILLTLSVAIANLNAGGLFLNEMDLSVEIAGTLKSLSSLFSNLSGILAPAIAGFLVQHNESVYEWNRVFYLTSAVLFIGASTFLLLGSAQNQNWLIEKELISDEIAPLIPENNNSRNYAEELHQ